MKKHRFHIHIPQEPIDLWIRLKRLAKRNDRTIKAEAMIALRNHLIENQQLTAKEIKTLQEYAEEAD